MRKISLEMKSVIEFTVKVTPTVARSEGVENTSQSSVLTSPDKDTRGRSLNSGAALG